MYGEILSPISEKLHPDSSDECPVGNGVYTVKMRLKEQIPQFLPVYSRKLRVQYRGVNKSCFNCYGNHNRQKCRNAKVSWIEYVKKFINHNKGIDSKWFGKWWSIVENDRSRERSSMRSSNHHSTQNRNERQERPRSR